ncbi:hypothetical protein HETIRDRAFT_102072 [Heterobasidion irregulare TC 32-1]|uniref:Uncharacterized protein n=1 Tax=Heterobasidion irregulare (strain TC 32-1) TaxID=747525 RepID=W4K6P0_HETIT|nr:uncharacterized protein HETIRDRAFT_102072 [Heterobasidion irregulare TC 32-1]ETW81010.1 hypothetical protein HETIRDRAFT_102072 [Heterobasidion irregulare TC 32-1]
MRHAAHMFSLKAGYTTLMMRDNLRAVPEALYTPTKQLSNHTTLFKFLVSFATSPSGLHSSRSPSSSILPVHALRYEMPPFRKVYLKGFLNKPSTSSNPPEHSLDKSPQTDDHDHYHSVNKSAIYVFPLQAEELQARMDLLHKKYSPDRITTVARTPVARKVPKDVTVDGGDETDTTSYLSLDEDGRNRLRSAPKGSSNPSKLPLGSRSRYRPTRFAQLSSFSSLQGGALKVVPKSAPLPTKHDSQHPPSRSSSEDKRSPTGTFMLPLSKISKSSSSNHQPAVAPRSTPPPSQLSARSVKSRISKPSLDTNASASEEFMSPQAPPLVSPKPPAFPSPANKAHSNPKPRQLAQSGLAQSSGLLKGVSKSAGQQRHIAPLHAREGHPSLPQVVASPSRFAAAKEHNAMLPPVKTSSRPAATKERSAMPPPEKTFPRPAADKGRYPVASPVNNSSHSSAKNERLPMGSSMQTSSHLNARNERLQGGKSAITSPRAGIMNERLHLTPLTTAFSQPYDASSSSSPNSDSPVSFAPAFNVREFIKNTRPNPSPSSPVTTDKFRREIAFFRNDSQAVEKRKYRNASVLHVTSVTNEAYRHSACAEVEAPKLMGSRGQQKAVAVTTACGNDKQARNTSREIDARRVGLKRSHAVYASIRP